MKQLKEENALLNIVIFGFGIIIILLTFVLLNMTYNLGVEKCINAGNNRNYCERGLR
nr:MAG TPA: hypothetical protein [Bacteriophage sp.]